jgi:Tol biopolymer transport system component
VSSRLASLGLVVLAVACGARTGLLAGGGESGSSGSGSSSSGSSSSSGGVTFDAGCPEPLWLLFNLRDDSGTSPWSGIYAMRADGTAGHRVSLPHSPALNASVSPDGSKLLYASYMPPVVDGGVDSTLYVYDFATQTATAVVTTTELTYSALSPDGRTVSYVTGYSLRAIDADGHDDRSLLVGPNSDGSGYGHPVFEPDSRTIVYATGGIIGAIRADGSNDVSLLDAIPGSFQYPNPAFSPDYQHIVVGLFCGQTSPEALRIYPFASLPGATCESGTILTPVNEGASPNSANDPSWGTNGLIAYSSYPDVFVIDAAGGTPVNLTAGLTGDAGTVTASDPVWAPGCAPIP